MDYFSWKARITESFRFLMHCTLLWWSNLITDNRKVVAGEAELTWTYNTLLHEMRICQWRVLTVVNRLDLTTFRLSTIEWDFERNITCHAIIRTAQNDTHEVTVNGTLHRKTPILSVHQLHLHTVIIAGQFLKNFLLELRILFCDWLLWIWYLR